MTTYERQTAIGVFTERGLAEKAIEELQQAGFTSEQIGFIAKKGETSTTTPVIPAAPIAGPGTTGTPIGTAAPAYIPPTETSTTTTEPTKGEATATGAVSGGVIGGLVGAAAALLIPGLGAAIAGGILAGVALGAVTGGLIGVLTSMGVPEDEARYYQDELKAGRTVVTVKAGERYAEAVEILRHSGAYDASSRTDTDESPVPPATHVPTDQEPYGTGTPAGPNYRPDVTRETYNPDNVRRETYRPETRSDTYPAEARPETQRNTVPPHTNYPAERGDTNTSSY